MSFTGQSAALLVGPSLYVVVLGSFGPRNADVTQGAPAKKELNVVFNRKQKADMAATYRSEAEISEMKRTRHGLEKMQNGPLRKKQRNCWNTWSKTDEHNKKHLS